MQVPRLPSPSRSRTHFAKFLYRHRQLRQRRLTFEVFEDRRLLSSAHAALDLFSTSPGQPRYVRPDLAWKPAPTVLFTGDLSHAQPLIAVGDPDGTPPVTPAARIDPNVPDSPFAGVVSVLCSTWWKESSGSGSLISPIHVLTAAHVVDLDHDGTIDVSPGDITVYLNQDNPANNAAGATAISVSEIQVHPDWTGFKNPVENDDVAILTLSWPAPWGVPIYPLDPGPFINAELIVMAGYGTTGDGVNGFISDSANYFVKRTGQNLASLHLLDDEGSGQREVFLFDFDGPPGHETGDVFKDGPTLGNDIEVTLGPGDSGGPSFLWNDANGNGRIEPEELTQFGINTFLSPRDVQPPLFGSFAGGMIVSTYLAWIDSVVGSVARVSPSLAWEYDTSGAYSVAVSTDGSQIAVGTADGLDLLDGQGSPLWTYGTGNRVLDIAMAGDASELAAVVQSDSSRGGGGPVHIFDRHGNRLETVSDSYYSSVSYSPQGDYYAVTYESWTGWYDQAALWDRSSGWLWHGKTIGESGSGSVSVSANGITATGAAMMGTTSSAVRIYGRTGSLTWTYPMSGTIGAEYSVAITADGNYVAAGNTRNANLHVLDVANKRLLWEYNTGNIQGVAVSGDGAYIVAGASDAVYLFDAFGDLRWATGIPGITDVGLSADASRIVVATASGKVYAFEVSTDPEDVPPPGTLESFDIVDAEVNSTGVPSQRKLAVTSDGRLHTVYHRLDPAGVVQIFHAESADGGETWVEEPITSGGGNKSFPALAVDSLDVLHLVWQDANQATYYTRKTTSWQTPEWVASYATTPAIAVDGNDHVHVVYGVYVYGAGYWGGGDGIRWRVRTPAGWQPEQRVSSDRYWSRFPAIAIDGDNRVHVAWNHAPRTTYYDVHYRVRTSSGWGTEVELNAEPDNEEGSIPSIVVDSANHAHIVWHHLSGGNWSIKYRKHSGTLEPTVDVVGPTPYPQVFPAVSLDAAGRVHVLWHGKHSGSPAKFQLRHREYTTSWEPNEILTASRTRDQTGVNVLFANHPSANGQRNNVLPDGCAFIWLDVTTIRYGTMGAETFRSLGIDRWWATVGVDKQISVTWTTQVTLQDQYFLDIDIEYLNSWDLTDKAEVTFNGRRASFDWAGKAELGELTPGVYQFEISSFVVPETPVVERITFQLIRDVFGPWNPSYSLTTLFVADHAETDLPSSFRIQDDGVCRDFSVEELVDHFAPILYFSTDERYAMPFDVQTSLDAARSAGKPDRMRISGDADDYLDLSSLGDGQWPNGSSQAKVYASVLACSDKHKSCTPRSELAINYWLHYPRSNWKEHGGKNEHEGDWEGATVFLKLKDGVWCPDRVAFGQHVEFLRNFGDGDQTDGGEVLDWELLARDGSHSHWFVGLGGHATYGYPGETTWRVGLSDYLELHFGLGETFASQGHVEYLPRVADGGAPSWLRYPGTWGDPDLDDDGMPFDGDGGPRGPVFQELTLLSGNKAGERWLDPWAWSDGFSTPLWQFDFDAGLFSTQEGYHSVQRPAPTPDLYGAVKGYGWSSLGVSSFYRDAKEIGDDAKLLRDGHYGQDAAFLVDLATAGEYLVNVIIGDVAPFYHDQIEVTAEEAERPQLKLSSQPGQFSSESFVVTVTDGRLDLRLRDAGGTDPNFVINALRIRPKSAQPLALQRTTPDGSGPLDADGTKVDTYLGTGAPADSWITVATTLGAIEAWQDVSRTYQGVQVQADSTGTFSFQVRRPSGTGESGNATATITAQEVLGRNLGSTTQEYQPPQTPATVLRFDMGASPLYTQSGFTFVGPRDIFSTSRGYGWSTRVAAADRPYSGFSDLNRDSHSGSNATFRVQTGGSGPFQVRVYLANPLGTGGYRYTYDNFDVTVEGSGTQNVALLAPGVVTVLDFIAGNPGGDNILDIQFVDRGGQNFNWVVSGIEITSGSFPADSPITNLVTEKPGPAVAGGVTIDDAMLAPLVAEAAARWSAADLTSAQTAVLKDLHVGVAHLDGTKLGIALVTTNDIRLDHDAAGWGWSVGGGAWPEVGSQRSEAETRTPEVGGPWPEIGDRSPITDYRLPTTGLDLMHALMHEIGHLLGYEHTEAGLMAPVLSAGRSSAEAVGPLGQAPWRMGPSSFGLHASSHVDVFAELDPNSSEKSNSVVLKPKDGEAPAPPLVLPGQGPPQTRAPRRSRLEQFERELDHWFAELAAADGEESAR